MKTFAYSAIDTSGQAVSGVVEAVDWPSAEQVLVAQGLKEPRASNLPAGTAKADGSAQTSGSLRPAEALELVNYVSRVAQAGLPLDGALRAIAHELPGGRTSAALAHLAGRLEAGEPVESAIGSLGAGLPSHLQALVAAGVRSGDFGESLDRILAHERTIEDMSGRLWQAVAYPLVLLGMLLAWMWMMSEWVLPMLDLEGMTREYGLWGWGPRTIEFQTQIRRLDDIVEFVPKLVLGGCVAIAAALLVVRLIGGAGAFSRTMSQLPLIGPAWWYRGLADFCGLIEIFAHRRLPLGEALRLCGTASRDAAVRGACVKAAQQVESGTDLATALAADPLFPPTVVSLLQWGQSHGSLAEAAERCRQMCCDRFDLQTQLVRLVLPPIVFVLLAGGAMTVLYAFFGPLFQLVSSLF